MKEFNRFAKPQELIDWLEENDLLMHISLEDAQILLDYMEGHDYAIGVDENNAFVRKDMAEEGGEIEEYSIDETVNIVCEWNYELMLEQANIMNNPDNFTAYSNARNKYDSLKQDEERLDMMFGMTSYGRKINEMSRAMLTACVRTACKKEDVLENAMTALENPAIYKTDKGR